MTKVDVFSGFLGAGKTTLIKKLLTDAYAGQQVVLIENEFGEIGIDGGFMQEAGIQVREMNSGCICCSLTGDFRKALREVIDRYAPDRIIIEPSGVGKLSDIVSAVEQVGDDIQINALGTVVDAGKAKMYMRNFGEFFNNQVESAGCIVLSRSQNVKPEKLSECVRLLREKNPGAVIITTPWDELSGEQILSALERRDTLSAALESIEHEHAHADGECDDPECECHHHHHDEEEHEHHHHHHADGECDDPECECHHHHHDEDEHEHEHEHDHDHEHEHHHHHHHHGHDADEVFTSWGLETARRFTEAELREKLEDLDDAYHYGTVLRAKGIVASDEGAWFHFDYTPGELEIRRGAAGITGRLCVIGAGLKEAAVAELFG